MRQARAVRSNAKAGLRLSEHIADTDGATVFRQACVMGLEGIVAKRRDSRYRSGRCREWIKVKNRAHPAVERAMLIALSKRCGSKIWVTVRPRNYPQEHTRNGR